MELPIEDVGGLIAVFTVVYFAWKIGSRLLSWLMTAFAVSMAALILTL